MNVSKFLESRVLDLLLRDEGYTPPATTYAALFTALTDDGEDVTEVSGNGYERPAISFNPASGGRLPNQLVQFADPTDDWGTVTHVGVYDAATTGNLLWWFQLAEARAVVSGQAPRFTAGNLRLSFIDDSALSIHTANALLNRVFRNQSWTSITPWMALSLVDPGPDGSSIVEPSGAGYVRVDTSGLWTSATLSAGIYSSVNNASIDFAQATGDWGEVAWVALFDASVDGNMILRVELDEAQNILDGGVFRVPAGEGRIMIDGVESS